MTALLPEQPVTVAPQLLRALGLVPRPAVPRWITDPNVIASVLAGLVDIPDDFATPANGGTT
ncbi:hypothetical protein [Streptomyces indicus]|uniref:Uncharacterized protein n=1 Tax=Streptomyces indicus TaxID=417292 RepID=A0A1G9IUZ4_9ACTN|nr:hypothetical protein [Streptomyces indicus]SDL29017.1 hypothetical protein SAMN05421806_12583 [Streptomyces indicus]